jgi:hypothetical protein
VSGSSGGRAPSQGPRDSISARTRAGCGSPVGRRAPRRCPARMRTSGSDAGWRGPPRTARATLPGEEGAGLVCHRSDREDDVGTSGHLGEPQLEADDELRSLDGGGRRSGVARVGWVHPADDETAQLTLVERGDDRVAVTTGTLGQRVDAPGCRDVHASGRVGDRTPTRQQGRQAARLDRTAVAPLGAAPRPAGHRSSWRGPVRR